MFLRVTSRKNADGSVVRYVALAHNERVNGQTRARVLVNLGREDTLDTDGLRRLVSSISRYLGDSDPYDGQGGDDPGALRVSSSRSLGGVWLLDGLWHQLGHRHRAAHPAGTTAVQHRRGTGPVRAGGQPGPGP